MKINEIAHPPAGVGGHTPHGSEWLRGIPPPSGHIVAREHITGVGSAVIFVRDIKHSVRFYGDVFGCQVAIHDRSAVLMIAPAGFQIYLRELGDKAHHPSHGIGVQCLIWTAATMAGLQHVKQALRDRNCYISTTTADGVTLVEGHDLDLVPVIVAYPSPDRLPRHSISPRVYNP